MPQQLPPLNSLRFFEAAARLGNYRLVAEELHVTASAVSHSILTLERWFGAELFARRPDGVHLTPAGQAFLPSVARALQLISDATHEIAGQHSNARVSVGCEPGFASRWLLPRLQDFAELHPTIAIRLDTIGKPAPPASNGLDLEIRHAKKAPAGFYRTKLLRDALVPVASPDLLGGVRADTHAQLLQESPLLRVPNLPDDWDFWLASAGITLEAQARDLSFGTVPMALEAAKQGLGLAMGRRLLVEDDFQAGRLVELSLPKVAALSSYWLVSTGPTSERRETRAFRRWLVEQIRASAAEEFAL